jgi:hypothetical protein
VAGPRAKRMIVMRKLDWIYVIFAENMLGKTDWMELS